MTQAPAFMKAAGDLQIAGEDKLEKARLLAEEYFQAESECDRLEAEFEDAKKKRNELMQKTIPEFFAQIQIDNIGLPEAGVDVVIKPYYKASISADWPEERQAEAFKVLEEIDGDDIITATVAINFFKEEYDDAKALIEFLRQNWPGANAHPARLSRTVHWGTLTSFIRAYSEDESMDPLTEEQKKALGATIGLVAKIEKRKQQGAKKNGKK